MTVQATTLQLHSILAEQKSAIEIWNKVEQEAEKSNPKRLQQALLKKVVLHGAEVQAIPAAAWNGFVTHHVISAKPPVSSLDNDVKRKPANMGVFSGAEAHLGAVKSFAERVVVNLSKTDANDNFSNETRNQIKFLNFLAALTGNNKTAINTQAKEAPSQASEEFVANTQPLDVDSRQALARANAKFASLPAQMAFAQTQQSAADKAATSEAH